MPVEARIEHALMHASKVHPQIRAEFESAYCVFWEKIPYSLGAFSGGSRRGGSSLSTLGVPDDRIFLGCAAVSGNGSWMEGAVAAAWQTLKALHHRAMTA